MKRKRITAFLTALSVITAFSALPVSAELYVSPAGDMSYLTKTAFSGVVVETDGTALTEEMVNTFAGYRAIVNYEDFTAPLGWGSFETSIVPDGTAYMLYTENLDDDALTALGRTLMLEMDFITNVYLVEQLMYEEIVSNYEIFVKTLNEEIVLSADQIPELEGFTIIQYENSVDATLQASDDTIAMMNEQEFTEYDRYLYFNELADSLRTDYADTFASVKYGVTVLEQNGSTEYGTLAAWSTAGDPNADGEVTAEDAADLLITAAEIGTGASIKATSAEDVNADGSVSADDAAAVLCYAAAQGSGNPLSWVDILRK